MRKTLGICLLVLFLTGTASAGIMQNGSPAPPPPPQTNAAQEPTDDATLNGEMQNDVSDILTEAALDLLAALL